MTRDYDSQLLESVAVRRRRTRDALLFGVQRARRTADERLGKLFAGIAIAAVLCAGCVGWSFIQHTLAKQKAEQQKQRQGSVQQFGQPSPPAKSPQPSQTSASGSPKPAKSPQPARSQPSQAPQSSLSPQS
ncbi:hypothetical protein OG756_21825 [Streptomyces sp. NBC_01310]|uniref:hypothetical protein n=1 Tax=Streptomyces sp. NBC_01310 TaxID=2903820 RepID=UPI0035B64939|nr:hypothetical protein OG756_21825 [Streptomyces sp. NBC_01310]